MKKITTWLFLAICTTAVLLSGCTITRPISVSEFQEGLVEYGFKAPAGPASGKVPAKVGIEFDESKFYKDIETIEGITTETLIPVGQIMKRASSAVFPSYFKEVEKVKEWLPGRYDVDIELFFDKLSLTDIAGPLGNLGKSKTVVKVTIGYKLYDRRGLLILYGENTSPEIASKPWFMRGSDDKELAKMIAEATALSMKEIAVRVSSILRDPELAVAETEKLVKHRPQDVGAFVRLANAQLFAGRPEDAIVAAKRGLEIQPGNTWILRSLGYAYYQTGKAREALEYFRQAKDLRRFGLLAMEIGAYGAAVDAFKEQAKKHPSYRNLFFLAQAEYHTGKFGDALTHLEKALPKLMGERKMGISIFKDQAEDTLVISEVFKNSPAKSAGLLEGDIIVELNGESTKGMDAKAFVKKLSNIEGDSAILKVKRSGSKELITIRIVLGRVVSKTAAEGLGLISLVQRQMGNTAGALKDAEQAYSLDSIDDWAQLALSAARLDQGRYDEALGLLSEVKDNTEARLLEAMAYAKKGDYQRAIDVYASIEENLSPKDVPFWSERRALLGELKPYVASKRENAARLKANGRYREALKELGEAIKVTDGAEQEAICGEITGMIATDPGLAVVPEEARKYALRGDVLTEEGKFEEAVKEYRKAVEAAPYIAKLYFNTAMVYGELKKYSQAIRYMKTYLLLAPEAPNARAAKDQIYKWEFSMEKGE